MLRLIRALLVGCCLSIVTLRALSQLPPNIDASRTTIWNCYSPMETLTMQDIHTSLSPHSLEIIHTSVTPDTATLELITTVNSSVELEAAGLANCTVLASMDDLVSMELTENWHNLRYHIEEDSLHDKLRAVVQLKKSEQQRVLRRSVDERGGDKCAKSECTAEETKREYDKEIQEMFSHYHNLSSMYYWYQKLSEDYPYIVRLHKTIGKSYYERDIMALHFTDRSELEDKPKIYLQCLLHSREWISGSVCMYLSYRLATPHPSDLKLLKLLKEIEFVIVPVANPDGYYATWTQYPKYRLWRKNVQPFPGSKCAGVDLNRNFDSHWDQDTYSRSDDPCSELYHGPRAGSELEVVALTNYFKSLERVIGAIDFHSYHQKILYPPAYISDGGGDLTQIETAAAAVAAAASLGGHTYTPHKMFDLYSAAGTFADWLLDYRNDPSHPDSKDLIPLTVELRPQASNNTIGYTGFMLPTSEILPTCEEMYSALLEFSLLVTSR